MRVTGRALQLVAVPVLCLGTLAMVAQIAAQPDPTAQQATVDTLVQQYFDQTATATAQYEQTQTLQAAFESAQTATAAFDATVQAAFAQAATATQQALPTLTPAPVPERVAATHILELTAGMTGQSAFLAPGGERFAHVSRDTVCIYTLEGVEERCVSLEDHALPVDLERIAWSPDGRYLAMTEDFFMLLYESDVWVLDADTGALTNIVDDGAEGGFLSADTENASFDVAPSWTADGRLAFLRLDRSDGDTSAGIYAVQADGSDLELIASITDKEGINVFAYDISRDGRYLAYNWMRDTDVKASGLWLRDLESGEERLLVEAEVSAYVPAMISFSPDGQYVLWMDGRLGTIRSPQKPDDSPMRVIAVGGGDPTLLNTELIVFAAWWAPEGHALAYLVRNQQDAEISGLYVSAVPGEAGSRVLEGMYLPLVSRVYQPDVWSANNTILLSNAPEQGLTVVQLGD